MRVAVIGGTGFVGGYLIDALGDASQDVSVMVRTGSEGKIQADVWREISGDIADEQAVDATIDGCHAVIYCIGILRESPAQGITFGIVTSSGRPSLPLASCRGCRSGFRPRARQRQHLRQDL